MKLTRNELKEIIREDLRKWFGKGKTGGWDRYNTKGEKIGKCGDGEAGDAYAACLSNEKSTKLGPKGRASFVRRKRAAQKKAGDAKKGGEQSKGQKPTLVKTKANEMKNVEEKMELFLEKNVPTDPEKWSYAKSQAKKKFDVYPSAYANGWAAKKYKELGGGWKTDESLVNEDNPCWDGYQQIGMKMKNGKEVPNCVPMKEVKKLREWITEIHPQLINESRAELELSRMIDKLKIKDKGLDTTIRTLIFSNTPRFIEQVMMQNMPEFN